ncbi:MAG: hypothetical protein HWE20_05760 [Gammaproteobacteria bacterium]|nr:hypothetical protein [Gammaproteobacteria bacterium]
MADKKIEYANPGKTLDRIKAMLDRNKARFPLHSGWLAARYVHPNSYVLLNDGRNETIRTSLTTIEEMYPDCAERAGRDTLINNTHVRSIDGDKVSAIVRGVPTTMTLKTPE